MKYSREELKRIFLQKAIEKHGNKFDYSKVEYITCKHKVILICSKHGEFKTTPDSHIQGSDCRKCFFEKLGQGQIIPKEEFIKRAIKIHGNRYNYSKIEYIDLQHKVNIICTIDNHGEFLQKPANHLLPRGCPKCKPSVLRKRFAMTKEEFIKRALEHHNNKYNYSKVEYHNCDTLVTIICPIHGEFQQIPYAHLNSVYGCEKCSIPKRGLTARKGSNYFLDKFREKHGDRYQYFFNGDKSLGNEPIKIVCPEHGEFFQNTHNHLNSSSGCPKCSFNNTSIEKFVQDLLKKYNIDYIEKDRTFIKPLELDIYIPKLNLGIECNGNYWHSELVSHGRNDHLRKLDLCRKKGLK